jgi:hypothetical protein
MGVAYIGWRDCSLQRALGPEGFQAKLELRAYRSVIEDHVPKERRESVRLRVCAPSGSQDLAYDDIVAALGEFEAGIPDCVSCPLADGRPLGCYRHVTYPIDAAFERLVFQCFTSRLADERSAARQLWPAIIAAHPTGARAGAGGGARVTTIDSAALCEALVASSSDPELVFVHARFWNELFEWLDKRLARSLRDEVPVPAALDSRTLREIHHVSELLNASVDRARTQGWRVLVEA